MKFSTDTGQSTVEFALCLPIVLLVVAAFFEIAAIASDQARLWHAAREAVRVATVDPNHSQVSKAARTSGLEDLEVHVRPAVSERVQGDPTTVVLEYAPQGRVPLLGRLLRRVALRASATMRIEQP